jgi:DNA-binding response OmpR family regulator
VEATSLRIVIASASRYRQGVYQAAVQGLGYQAVLVERGIDCVGCLRQQGADLLVLESFLPWGGCDGVLEIAQVELGLNCPVIVVAVGGRGADWLQLSRFRVDDFLPRFPTLDALQQALKQALDLAAARPEIWVADPADQRAVPAWHPVEREERTSWNVDRHVVADSSTARPAAEAVEEKKLSEKRHLPEGCGLSSAYPGTSVPVPQLLAAEWGISVRGGSISADPPGRKG